MTANSGIGRSLPIPAQTNAADLYVLQTPTANTIYIFNGLLWQRQVVPPAGATVLVLATNLATPVNSYSGTGDKVHAAVTLAGLPSTTATGVFLTATFTCSQPGAQLIFAQDTGGDLEQMALTAQVANIVTVGNGLQPIVPGATNQISYRVTLTSGGTWTANFFVVAWTEPLF